jgi:hypothetical protein
MTEDRTTALDVARPHRLPRLVESFEELPCLPLVYFIFRHSHESEFVSWRIG